MRAAREGRLLRLTLDRPEKRNALNTALCRELVGHVEQAAGDHRVGAILLEADGPAFCAGMDLEESLEPDAASRTVVHEQLFTIGARAARPLIAAVQGPALAGGTGLVANMHVAVAAEDATFGLPEMRIGMWPLVVWRAVVAAVGERRAMELSLTGRIFGAAEALDWGLIHYIVPAAELAGRAGEIARKISEASPLAVERGLELARRSREISWQQGGELALKLRAEIFAAGDYAEGVRAFREKRPPRWPSLKSEE